MRTLSISLLAVLLGACTNLTQANEEFRKAMALLQGGTEEALERGKNALELAANLGSPDAAVTLGYYYLQGAYGYTEDARKALELFLKAARAGSADGAYNAGYAYLRGRGTDVDLPKAYKWFREAAYKGDAGAQYNVAVMELNGEGTEKDPLSAFIWFYLADEQGYEGAKEGGRVARKEMTVEQARVFEEELEKVRAKIEPQSSLDEPQGVDTNVAL